MPPKKKVDHNFLIQNDPPGLNVLQRFPEKSNVSKAGSAVNVGPGTMKCCSVDVSQFQDIWRPVNFSTVENCYCRWGTSQRILAKNNIRQHLGPRYLYTARPSDGNGCMDISMVLVPGWVGSRVRWVLVTVMWMRSAMHVILSHTHT